MDPPSESHTHFKNIEYIILNEKEQSSTYITPPLPENPNNFWNIRTQIIICSSLICVLIIPPQNIFKSKLTMLTLKI